MRLNSELSEFFGHIWSPFSINQFVPFRMKIIQLTDLHIGQPHENTHGVDVRANFLEVLKNAVREAPDHLVVSGDLCLMQGDAGVYEWIKKHLDQTGIPYDLISGNHDDPEMLARVFGREKAVRDGQLFYRKNIGDQLCLFLDTTHYELPPAQVEWLGEQLARHSGRLLIFIHHPVLSSGVPFMDGKHGLRNMETVQDLLFQYGHPVHLFCGHYHVDKVVSKKNISVYITPSAYFQISDRTPDFSVDHYRIGFRTLRLEGDILQTSVRYFEGHTLPD
ncbi:MAG: metallophosphoesterase [Bacteroidetes bacterium]|nr:MAG: metallophosphoesterase [Bacteroidota bacterium]